ncbi:MAG: ThuA domain-containing protein [Bryobacteraceae bacterium]
MNRLFGNFLATSLGVLAASEGFSQSPAAPVTAAPPRVAVPGRGIESVRWEPWSAMRTAAAPILGWKIGVSGGALKRLTFFEAMEKADAVGIGDIEGFSSEKVSEEIPKSLGPTLLPGEIRGIKDKLNAVNMRMDAYHVPSLPPEEKSMRELFDFARELSIETIVSDTLPVSLPAVDKLAEEFGVNVAFCGAPHALSTALRELGKRVGACLDGESGDALKELKERTLIVNVSGATSSDNLSGFLLRMYRLNVSPALIAVSPSSGEDLTVGLEHSFNNLEKALVPVMTDKVDTMARSMPIRGPDRLSPEDREHIEAALPKEAPAKPKKARKLLVLDLNIAYGGHRSIPAENFGLEQMGKQTGAYQAVFSNDLDNLKYPKIKDFDAVYLNNTVGMIFVDPAVREGLLRFVREGGGLGGNHGTSHASMDWPEFHDMIGVTRGVHRASTEKAWVKVDDPNSPLTSAFAGKEFFYEDEYFRFPNPPYSRNKLHVLLSLDVEKTDMNQGQVFVPGSHISRPDADYAVSWIREYGKGRVFFCILGHNPTLFTTPSLAKYFLAGIQYILGDLQADATPSSKLSASTAK